MKKLIFIVIGALLLNVFVGCQKEELIKQDDGGELPEAATNPDVYSENGYLVFKDMMVVDSIVKMLSSMNEMEKKEWEYQFGFESARAEFNKLYDEYLGLNSVKELYVFKKRNEKRLRFDGEAPSDWSIDYPYSTCYFVPVLNKDGIYKIGKSLVKYTMDDQIIILDGDLKKLNNLGKYINNDNVVFMTKLKSYGDKRIYLDDFEDDNLHNVTDKWSYNDERNRRLRNQLIWDTYYYSDGANIYSGWKLLFHQKAEKYSYWKWRRYKTVYGTKNIYVKVGDFSSYWINRYVASYTHEVYYSTIECGAHHLTGTTSLFYYRPNVAFSSETYCRGLGEWYTVNH